LVITALQVAQGNAITIDNLEDAMDLYHCNVINEGKGTNHDEEGKVVLSGFTGACYKCGEVGHTKANCPKKQSGKSPRSNKSKTPRRKCEVCGKEHAGPCWEDESNAHLRPANWKLAKAGTNIAAAAVAASTDKGELLLTRLANVRWDNTLMPKGMSQDKDMNKDSVERVITDDVKDVVTDNNNPHWFPFQWFLDAEDGQVGREPVVIVLSVTRTNNKSRNSNLVERFANRYALEVELGLKVEGVSKKMTFPSVRALLSDPDVFIADSGATTHATVSIRGLKNLHKGCDGDFIEVASGLQEAAAQIGDLPCVICDKHGQELQNVVLHDVTYSPSLKFNLFSTSKLQQEGWKMMGDFNSITMTKEGMTVGCDIVIPTNKGAIYCVYLKRGCEMANVVAQGMGPKATMTIKQAHDRFGHNHKDATQAIAKHLGIRITQGKMKPCEGCMLAKAKQKNVLQVNTPQVCLTKFGECIYSNISTIRQVNGGPTVTKPNWHMLVDDE
jgi:hypothetical protein